MGCEAGTDSFSLLSSQLLAKLKKNAFSSYSKIKLKNRGTEDSSWATVWEEAILKTYTTYSLAVGKQCKEFDLLTTTCPGTWSDDEEDMKHMLMYG